MSVPVGEGRQEDAVTHLDLVDTRPAAQREGLGPDGGDAPTADRDRVEVALVRAPGAPDEQDGRGRHP
ncbi:MAG: hypothetical protein ACRCYR_17325 [Phycicoccus sp.]